VSRLTPAEAEVMQGARRRASTETQALVAIIDRLVADTWIPVASGKLPAMDVVVLATNGVDVAAAQRVTDGPTPAWKVDAEDVYDGCRVQRVETWEVTHWMPIPLPCDNAADARGAGAQEEPSTRRCEAAQNNLPCATSHSGVATGVVLGAFLRAVNDLVKGGSTRDAGTPGALARALSASRGAHGPW